MRVLLCDDHRLFAESFAALLISLGHEVVGIAPFPLRAPESVPEPAGQRATAAWTARDADVCVVDPGAADLVELSEGLRMLEGPASGEGDAGACLFVVLTAEDGRTADGLRSLLEARIRGVVSKRRSAAEIIEALGVVHRGGIYFDPDLVRRALTPETAQTAGARPYSTPYPANLLTQRELEVLGWLVHGAATGDMASAMGISAATVRSHIKAAMSKLGVSSRLQAAARAISLGLVEPPSAADPAVGC